MQVQELANLTGVPAHVIRYYTQIGLLTPRSDPKNNYRDYMPADVGRLRFIRRAKWLGFTLRDVRSILSDADNCVSPCPEARKLITQRARENRARLEQFNRLQSCIEAAITIWESMPDPPPDHNSLCHLIEALTVSDAELDGPNGVK